MLPSEILVAIEAADAAWQETHGALFDLGMDAATHGDHDTFALIQLLLNDLSNDDA